MNVRQRLFLVAATAIAALAAAGVYAQEEATNAEKLKKAEAQAQEKEIALKKMAAQLEAQQAEFQAQRAALAAQREALQKVYRDRQMQNDAKRSEYQDALDMFGERRTNAEAGAMEYLKMHQQLEAARQQLAQLEALKQKVKAAPLPENAELRVFSLRHSKLPDVSRVLAEIVGDRGLRLAVDERTNSLVVTTDKDTMNTVEALLQKLDSSGDRATSEAPPQTLQLRTVWLLDGVEGKKPAVGIDTGNRQSEGIVSPQVVEALHLLGFEDPKVVCQQVTTLTLGEDNRRGGSGRFEFSVPVLVAGESWQLSGDGVVTPRADNRYSLEFDLGVAQRDNPQISKIRGSIYTPLGHYTVMGTTTFVRPGKDGGQHLSAFVVYLDRAPEFPAASQQTKTAPTSTFAE